MTNEVKHHALESLQDAEATQLEDSLWWIQGRKDIIRRFLRDALAIESIFRIIDIGCGSGGNFDVLAEYGAVIGVEPSPTLAARARVRGIASMVYQCDIQQVKECCDAELFTMFDVLEHIEEDVNFLRGLRAAAPQRHLLLASVPACPFLYGEHDEILHHQRRYSKNMLRRCLTRSGYEVLSISHFMFFLFPFAFVARAKDKLMSGLGKRRTSVDLGSTAPLVSKCLSRTLRVEALLSKHISFPLGLWLFALARSTEHGAKSTPSKQ